MSMTFSQRLLGWFDRHGRKDLPWQQSISPYRVWVSEIMLQQTQVQTVIPYYIRFMEALPDVEALAKAPQDQVLHHWTGLGYYARARNLQRAARIVVEDMSGRFPTDVETLITLPGIGRSTAGAITSIAGGARAPILDGNVKRVLARFHRVAGWPGKSAVMAELWELAEQHTPSQRVADYTQAIMDLGATVCTRSKPACDRCPLALDCEALANGNPGDYPGRKPKKTIPTRATVFIIIQNAEGDILMERRPPQGIWGGLWCFPQVESTEGVDDWLERQGVTAWGNRTLGEPFRHTFSHYHLDIQPLLITDASLPEAVMAGDKRLWYNRRAPATVGLAAPVARLLKSLD